MYLDSGLRQPDVDKQITSVVTGTGFVEAEDRCKTLVLALFVQEMQIQEKKKKGDKQKNEYYQTQWRKHVDKLTIPPKQTPAYLAVSKPSEKKKHRTGEGSLGSQCRKYTTTVSRCCVF